MNLEYEPAYKIHCGVKLASDQRVSLKIINQSQTYAGLIEGVPFKDMNDSIVEEALKAAEWNCMNGAKPFLLAPTRRNYLREPGDMDHMPTVIGPAEWIPLVRCIGVFSNSSNKHPGTHESYLTIVWFQDEYAMPIDARILERIAFINWNAVAVDVAI